MSLKKIILHTISNSKMILTVLIIKQIMGAVILWDLMIYNKNMQAKKLVMQRISPKVIILAISGVLQL